MNIEKKRYTRPTIKKVEVDNSISLVMMSGPIDPPPPPSSKKGSDPFSSPFEDKPFG